MATYAQRQPAPAGSAPEPPRPEQFGVRQRVWVGLSTAFAAFLGLLPHILHHAGPLAGAALFAGVGGSILFGVIGLIAAIPFLLRVHRRHGGWRLPATLLVLFAAMFSVSAFVIGPAINGGEEANGESGAPAKTTPPAPSTTNSGHQAHHE